MDQSEFSSFTGPESNAENKSQMIRRDDLLKALDSEIADRESDVKRLGLSTWGLVVAWVAIFWMIVNELLEKNHELTETMLVFFVAFNTFGVLRYIFGEVLSFRPVYGATTQVRRYSSVRGHMSSPG